MTLNHYTETPQNDTPTQYANLETIKKRASAEVKSAQETRATIETEERQESVRADEAEKKAGLSNAEADLAANIGAEVLLGGAGRHTLDAAQLLGERIDAARAPSPSEKSALGDFIGEGVQTMDDMIRSFSGASSFTITERATLAGKALTGKSEAAGDDYMPSTKGWRGTETQMTVTGEMANKRNYDMAIRMQAEYEARMAQQLRQQGLTPGGMGGMQQQLAMNKFAPKGPRFEDADEETTNWGAGSVTG